MFYGFLCSGNGCLLPLFCYILRYCSSITTTALVLSVYKIVNGILLFIYSSLPELLEKKRLVDMHTNVATAILEQIKVIDSRSPRNVCFVCFAT